MGAVGLLFVGAILFLNGVMLLGWVEARSAAPLNLMVGGLQVVTPTYLIFTANGNPDVILNASGLYLFGFTYLYVGFGLLAGLDTTGVGYYSAFVAVAAVVYSGINFFRFEDKAFGVIWLYWAFLWLLFFLLLGLKIEGLTRYTGAVTAIQGWVTGVIPAFLLLSGNWLTVNNTTAAVILAIFGVVVFAAIYVPLRPGASAPGAPSTADAAAAASPA